MNTCKHDSVECFFNTKAEEDFLFSLLDNEMDVLEWGSGTSTIAIGKRVKSVISIEHDFKYFRQFKSDLPNIKVQFVERNKQEKNGHDGTYDDYRDYIEYPKSLNKKFDLIFIDGRARVECAKVAIDLLKQNGIILIHDYRNPNPKCDRPEYREVEKFLDIIDFNYALYTFKPKKINEQ